MMITIARYSFPYEAHIAKAKLECAGIKAFVADEHTINMQWLYSDAIGGVRLQVAEPFAKQAYEILNQNTDEDFFHELGYEAIPCPHCNSLNTEYYPFRQRTFLSMLLLDVALLPSQDGIRCLDCGQRHRTRSGCE